MGVAPDGAAAADGADGAADGAADAGSASLISVIVCFYL